MSNFFYKEAKKSDLWQIFISLVNLKIKKSKNYIWSSQVQEQDCLLCTVKCTAVIKENVAFNALSAVDPSVSSAEISSYPVADAL